MHRARIALAACAVMSSVTWVSPGAHAVGIITVDSTSMVGGDCNVAGACTFPAAITAAISSNNMIHLPRGTYQLTGTMVVPDGATIEIDGDGASSTTITGDGSSRLFEVSGGSLTLADLTLAKGFTDVGGGAAILAQATSIRMTRVDINDNEAAGDGGAVSVVHGSLTLDTVHASRNTGQAGGAIFAVQSPVAVTASTFDDNTGSQSGGAVYASYSPSLSITNSTFTGNGATVNGGAFVDEGAGDLGTADTVNGDHFTDNDAGHWGGAIYVPPANSITATGIAVSSSTFDGNHAGAGGAMAIADPPVSVTGSMFSGNTSDDDGGAIASATDLTITDSGFVGNHSNGSGGAIASTGPLTTTHSSFTGNSATGSGGVFDLIGVAPSIDATFSANTAEASGPVALWTGTTPLLITGVAASDIAAPLVSVPVDTTSPSTTTTSPGSTTTSTTPAPTPGLAGRYVPTVPVRVLDTRSGLGAPVRALAARQTLDVVVGGMGGVPTTGVAAVVLNVTAIAPQHDTFVTLWPTGTERPTTSNVNAEAGSIVPNVVVAQLGVDGKVSIYTNGGDTDFVVDVQGWFLASGSYQPIVSARLADTRVGLGIAAQPVGADASIDIAVTGAGGVPATGVTAVVLNVTAVAPTVDTFVTVWSSGGERPFTSNLNPHRGATVANLVIASVGSNGKVSLYNHAGQVDLVVDVQGYFTGPGDFVAVTPTRIGDTRIALGAPGPVAAGSTIGLAVTGIAGVPSIGVGAVLVNVTAVSPDRSTFITVWPSGVSRPLASNVNVAAGAVAANEVIATVGADGRISVYVDGANTDLVVDIEGWFQSAAP